MVTYVSIISRRAFEHDHDSGTIYSLDKIAFMFENCMFDVQLDVTSRIMCLNMHCSSSNYN